MQRQVTTLKTKVAKLARANTSLSRQVSTLKTERDGFKSERDLWIAEAARLKQFILNEVHSLANAWRNDNNPKTEVSYYESGGNYWSYSFTWCGFC